jgi:hypothetical protein
MRAFIELFRGLRLELWSMVDLSESNSLAVLGAIVVICLRARDGVLAVKTVEIVSLIEDLYVA